MADPHHDQESLTRGITDILQRMRDQRSSSGSIDLESLLFESVSDPKNGQSLSLFHEIEAMVQDESVSEISERLSSLLSKISTPPEVPDNISGNEVYLCCYKIRALIF